MIHENCDFVNISSLLSLYILESIIREIKGVFIWISRAQDPAWYIPSTSVLAWMSEQIF